MVFAGGFEARCARETAWRPARPSLPAGALQGTVPFHFHKTRCAAVWLSGANGGDCAEFHAGVLFRAKTGRRRIGSLCRKFKPVTCRIL